MPALSNFEFQFITQQMQIPSPPKADPESAPSGTADLDRLAAFVDEARRADRLRLPPEAELAGILGITRGRLRALLKKMEAEGLIWRHVGKGTFIGERNLVPQVGSLAEVVNSPESFEARLILEPQLAALAALRATSPQVEEMRECIQRMEAPQDFESWAVWDQKLHRLVARAARNTLLLALYDTVRESMPSGMRSRINKVFAEGPHRNTNDEHRAYVDAIAEGDAEKAADLMRAHLLSIRSALFGDH